MSLTRLGRIRRLPSRFGSEPAIGARTVKLGHRVTQHMWYKQRVRVLRILRKTRAHLSRARAKHCAIQRALTSTPLCSTLCSTPRSMRTSFTSPSLGIAKTTHRAVIVQHELLRVVSQLELFVPNLGPWVFVNTKASVNIAYAGDVGSTQTGAQRCVQTVRTTSVSRSHTMSIQVAHGCAGAQCSQTHRCLQTGVSHHYSEVSTRACCLQTGVGPRTAISVSPQ
jgi:hypothetical protein